MNSIFIALVVLMTASISVADQDDKIIRRQRDGNVMETGCEELDAFIQNISKFTKKIAAMFYNLNSHSNNDDVAETSTNAADEKNEEDRKSGLEYSQTEVRSHKPSDFGVFDANRRDADGLMHLDLLPIN